MKKLIIVLLLALLIYSLTGCFAIKTIENMPGEHQTTGIDYDNDIEETVLVNNEWANITAKEVFFYEEISAGGRRDASLKILAEELEMYRITNLADIQMKFWGLNDYFKGFDSDVTSVSTGMAEDYDYETDSYINTLKNPEKLDKLGAKLHYLQEEDETIVIDSQNINFTVTE